MKESTEQLKAMIADAREDTTHTDSCGFYYVGDARALADIAEIIKLREQIQGVVNLIYNAAVGKLAMDVNVDIESIAQSAYSITGINAEKVDEKK